MSSLCSRVSKASKYWQRFLFSRIAPSVTIAQRDRFWGNYDDENVCCFGNARGSRSCAIVLESDLQQHQVWRRQPVRMHLWPCCWWLREQRQLLEQSSCLHRVLRCFGVHLTLHLHSPLHQEPVRRRVSTLPICCPVSVHLWPVDSRLLEQRELLADD